MNSVVLMPKNDTVKYGKIYCDRDSNFYLFQGSCRDRKKYYLIAVLVKIAHFCDLLCDTSSWCGYAYPWDRKKQITLTFRNEFQRYVPLIKQQID